MGNIVEELTNMLIFSAVLNALLLGLLIYIAAMSRPVLTHFVAKLMKQPLLLVERDDGRWGLVRVKYGHGFSQHKTYGDFQNIPGSFKSLAGVPLAVVYEKAGVTVPLEFAAKATLLKTIGKKLSDFVKLRNVKNAPGYEVESVQDVKVYAYEVDEDKRELLEAFADEKWEEEKIMGGTKLKVRGYTIRVKDIMEYMLFSLNPINLRARVNARVMEELASRQRTEPLKYAFAFMIVILGLVFGLIMLDVWFGHPSANVAQQVQSTVNQIVPVSITKGP